MAVHAQGIIEEIIEEKRNPVAARFERMQARRAASRLAKRHGEALVREILSGLAEVPDFPPSSLLWNAIHWDVPLSCFLRMRREPVFRVLKIEERGRLGARVEVEHGQAKRREATREEFVMRRDWQGHFVVERRRVV